MRNTAVRSKKMEISRLASEKAWEETMEKNCDCGASSKSECRCQRTGAYKRKARKYRKEMLGEEWDNPIPSAMKRYLNLKSEGPV